MKVKTADFQAGDRLRHVLFAAQFSRQLLERLTRSADRIRTIARHRSGHRFLNQLLSDKRAMLYFTQPSTRTFLSFEAACQILGITCSEVRDSAVSSESKGESPFDSVRTFSSYFNLIIMRSVVPTFAECCAYMMNDLEKADRRSVPLINAGSGKDEHPTQALLDIYTIQRAFGFTHERDSQHWNRFDELSRQYPGLTRGLSGKVIGFCGDIRRGRTVKSLAQLLALYDDMTLVFIGPPTDSLSLPDDLRSFLRASGVKVVEINSFDDLVAGVPAIEAIDCLYMTRIQAEHNTEADRATFAQIDFSRYKLTRELVARMKAYAPILHPFPRDKAFNEIPVDIDRDERAYYFRQARNGMWIRAALLAHIFDVDSEIADHYDDFTIAPAAR